MTRSAALKNSSSSSSCFLSRLTMASVSSCLILVSLCGLCWEHRAAALPASTVQVRVGEDATLHCPLLDTSTTTSTTSTMTVNTTTSSAPSTSSNLSWYRKAAGQSPQLLLTMRSAGGSRVKYGSGVRPDKVSAAADGSLLLRRSEQSDAAVYYCGLSQGPEPRDRKQKPRRLTKK
ncbi:secreted immunoglobulin domain 1 [Lates calcarifer]|uniref:secreted immunoglobulin domain 1 n=1 Tax=Lates calcarifer TaxID=8187 RepID=UPI0021D78EDD|nr:secreted immunoglobulin domain 1 [Lates calcarifer]XP_050923756.1 secreted immunoglobulin domain 1 [Lates calcarifer]